MLGKSVKKNKFKSEFPVFIINVADAQMVSRMRMVLAVSVLMAVFIDPLGLSAVSRLTWFVFFGYLIHSIVIYIYSRLNGKFSQTILIHRLDVLWFALIVVFTGSIDSFFFLLFFFAILTSSFGWGFQEGARVTIASVILFTVSGFFMLGTETDLSRLLLRSTFLLVFGYLSVHWGESKVKLMHQLELLRDVSRLSNPRFGVDQTITSAMEKILNFYKASSCLLILYNKESGAYSLRTVKEGTTNYLMNTDTINAELISPLIEFLHNRPIIYASNLLSFIFRSVSKSLLYDHDVQQWYNDKSPASKKLAELLDVRAFISVPISLMRQKGRIYVASNKNLFDKSDALFLNHIVAQIFPVIENIEVLNKMASQAASQERCRISLNIHDSAIQSYIGLKLALEGLRNKASIDNPLIEDIDKLILMADNVIYDLRRYAVNLPAEEGQSEPILLVMLNKQAAQFKEFYGIDFSIATAGEVVLSDRLAAEVLQLVREGLSNICKHTFSQEGFVNINCANGLLTIQIENKSEGAQPLHFFPKSISERVTGLGGNVHVTHGPEATTVVNIEIPI